MDNFGEIIRKHRLEKDLPLRVVAAYIDIDQAILSKIETGKRKASREMVVKLADFFKISEKDLLTSWLADKLVYEAGDEEVALKAMQMAEEEIQYKRARKITIPFIKQSVKKLIGKDERIKKVWLFGSYARGESDYKSDIDLLLELEENTRFTYFDLAGIQHDLEQSSGKKVDVGFYGNMKPEAWERVKKDIKLIYEK